MFCTRLIQPLAVPASGLLSLFLLPICGVVKTETVAGIISIAEEPKLKLGEKLKIFLGVHWKGLVCIFCPIICSVVLRPFPPEQHQWTLYLILIIIIFWTTECIPLPITSLLPLAVYPITGIMNSSKVCSNFMNDTIFLFIGSLILAASIEQSGLHKRMAFIAIRSFGYSHVKLLMAIVVITSFASMWITSAAATIMMVPIIFAVLKSFEDQKLIKMYDVTKDGDKVASDITTCYFCTATFGATIGGNATLMGSITNLSTKGYFARMYPKAPDYLNFSSFSAFAFPLTIVLDTFMILYMLVVYIGVLRPKSAAAKQAKIPADGLKAAEAAVSRGYDALGPFSFWEFMVLILFTGALIALFCRSPVIFDGLNEVLTKHLSQSGFHYIRDSTLLAIVTVLMLWLPSNFSIFNNCSAKFHEELPKESIPSLLNWKNVMAKIPFSIIFIIGAGISIAEVLINVPTEKFIFVEGLKLYSDEVNILFIIIFATTAAHLSTVVWTVGLWTQMAMIVARTHRRNAFWYMLPAAFSSNYCFMLPGNANNAVVQRAAKIPSSKMIKAGLGPTISSVFITWLALYFYAPIVWPVVKQTYPAWMNK